MRAPAILLLLLVAACGDQGGSDSPAGDGSTVDAAAGPAGTGPAGTGPAGAAPDAATPAPDFSAEVLAAAAGIAADDLRDTVTELSSDQYGGRGPASEGDEKTRGYLVQRLEALGYAPGAGTSYQQPFELVSVNAAQPDSWAFRADGETVSLVQGEDFIVASGVQAESAGLADAELVFVGYGIQAPEYRWDDFGTMDLSGKVLVMLNNDPHWDPELFEGDTRLYYGRWTYKYESAARQGAAGAIIIHTTPSAGYPWQVVQTSWSGPQFELPQGDEPRLAVKGWFTYDAAAALLEAAGQALDELEQKARHRNFVPVPLGITTSIALQNQLTRTGTANVLGLLEGSDPALREQVVVYTAHHDHLGVREGGDGDDHIYNGALDNAAGMAQVLAIAEAIAALPEAPRRSTLIAFVGAEEQGLLGSLYYARNPTFAPGRIAANINYDGGAIWGEASDIGYIGFGKSSLDEVAGAVAAYQGRTLTGDQDPSKGSYYRSDQFSFARIGVPAIYTKAGRNVIGKPDGWGQAQMDAYTEQHYHQVSDELTDDWTFSGMVQDAEFGFLAGMLVSNQDALPQWQPGDEFEDERQAALAALAE